MNFIIEGMDRCGKSTLVDRLPEIMDHTWPIISTHFPKIKFQEHENKVEYCKKLYSTTFAHLNYLTMICGQFIMDRSHISEYVYGQLYRDYDSRYALQSEQCMDFASLVVNTTLIVLVDNPENIQSREDGKSNSTEHTDLVAEFRLFKYAFLTSILKKKVFICVDKYTEEEVFTIVKDHQLHQFNKNGDIYNN
jgi:thymidylate kinase